QLCHDPGRTQRRDVGRFGRPPGGGAPQPGQLPGLAPVHVASTVGVQPLAGGGDDDRVRVHVTPPGGRCSGRRRSGTPTPTRGTAARHTSRGWLFAAAATRSPVRVHGWTP